MRYPSMNRKRTKAAHEYYQRVEREAAEREATARRSLLLLDQSFAPKRIEGDQAFAEGKLRRENPYDVLSGEFVHWDAGWRDAYQRNS